MKLINFVFVMALMLLT
jgi:uncharacterized protein YicC (UPF0701 family)